MPTGRVKWFDRKKGFGFIIGPVGQDVFVHYTHIIRVGFKYLKEGEPVRYHLLHTDKGWQARGVEPTDEAMLSVNGNVKEPAAHYEPPIEQPTTHSPEPARVDDDSDSRVHVPRSGGYVGAPDYAEVG